MGDKLYKCETEDIPFECPQCGWEYHSLFVLAETQSEADKIRAGGGGLCGGCMCENIIATHGEVRTQRAYINR